MEIWHYYQYNQNDGNAAASVHIQDTGGVLWLTNVWTHKDYRGQHLIRSLIEQGIADFGHRSIYLKVQPYADAPMDRDALAAYYTTFGFAATDVPDVMVRRALQEVNSDATP